MFENSSQKHDGVTTVADNRQQGRRQKTSKRGKTFWANQHRSVSTDGPDKEPVASQQASTLKKIQNFKVEFGPRKKDIVNFTNQLAVMIRAGISLQDSLESIAEQQANQKLKVIIISLKNQIESGQSFSQALAEHSDVFSSIYINMVAAAEVSGSLSEMLQKLAEYLQHEAETRSQIRGAMVYPAIIAFMAIAVTVFLLCFVLPKFGAIFSGKEHLLPKPTKILMGTSAFMLNYWFLIVPAIGGAIGGFFYFIRTNVGRQWWDRTKLVLPIIKKLCKSLYITRSLHTMGVLTHAGVPILDTVSITAKIAGNILYKNMWLGVHEDVRQGKKIASSLGRYDLMPSDVVQMIRSGEDSGTMSSVLKDVSEYYAKQLKIIIKTVTSMIEPIMIVLMGLLVGFIAMSIMLPIFKMSNLVSGR
ncbi:MAG: type II secretion system F family protein [Planctomycetota bacterium]|jgi:type IV pilus assembly protein PilC